MDAHHTHTNPSTPGYFSRRAPSLNDRNFSERAFTVGIGVPVGTGFFYQEMRDANGQWELEKIQSTSAETLLVTANAVKVFTEELFTANPDILEGVEDVIQLSYLN